MKPEMRAKIIAYNRERAADREKSDDLMTLLAASDRLLTASASMETLPERSPASIFTPTRKRFRIMPTTAVIRP